MNKKKKNPHLILNITQSGRHKHIQSCEVPGCSEAGDYKAPRRPGANSRRRDDYYMLCLHHVQEYNKNWDYFKNLSADEIDRIRNRDITWDRPSWPFGQGGRERVAYFSFMQSWQKFAEDIFDFHDEKQKQAARSMTLEQEEAITLFNLTPPFTQQQLKATYKQLVKKYHPDVNKGDKKKEDTFKKLSRAYKLLEEFVTQEVPSHD